jgi:hypothetical protein
VNFFQLNESLLKTSPGVDGFENFLDYFCQSAERRHVCHV